MKKNDWKDRLNLVYSTNTDFQYEGEEEIDKDTLPAAQQNLRVQLDRKNRGGKVVTLITGFIGSDEDLKELGKMLKMKCGVGGAAKDGEIIVQGDFKQRILELLKKEGYTLCVIGGGVACSGFSPNSDGSPIVLRTCEIGRASCRERVLILV